MQMRTYRLDARGLASDTLQVLREQSRGPHRTGDIDRMRVQLDHPLQLGEPGRRHLDGAAWVLARTQASHAFSLKSVQHRPHLVWSTSDQPGDLGGMSAFVG